MSGEKLVQYEAPKWVWDMLFDTIDEMDRGYVSSYVYNLRRCSRHLQLAVPPSPQTGSWFSRLTARLFHGI